MNPGEHDDLHDKVYSKRRYRVAVQCGWCDECVAATTGIGVHIRLLWHQWWNHRRKIWEEY